MKLGEFIEKFSHNNIVRLVHKEKGGHKLVLEDWNDVSMDHEITRGKGKNRHYINNEVLGLATICFQPGQGHHYPEALNIVIEELENQPTIEDKEDVKVNQNMMDEYYSSIDEYDSAQYLPNK
jgi:hypothetical protein